MRAVPRSTSVTVTFSGIPGFYRECYAYEVSGALTFDTAADYSHFNGDSAVAALMAQAESDVKTGIVPG